MNYSESKRQCSVIPSSRKSIHSYRNCNLPCCSTMGRYGIYGPQAFQANNTLSADYDEVDNIISKYQRSPKGIARNRRNSWSSDKFVQTSSESDIKNIRLAEHTLAQSVPDELPSYLSYRDIADEEIKNYQSYDSIQNSSSSTIEESFHTPLIKQNERNIDQSHNNNFKRTNNIGILKRNRKSFYVKSFFIKLIGLIISPLIIKTIIVIIVLNIGINLANLHLNVYDESNYIQELSGIGQKYNISNNAILQIQSGVSTTYKNEDTVTYIFAYDSEKQKNYEPFKCFVNEVANVLARYLRNDTTQDKHLIVRHEDLTMSEHGELVNKFQRLFKDHGVILFEDLDKIPVHLVRAFHYYCDEFNPLAKRSAMLFTMDMHECSIDLHKEVSHGLIESCLRKKWSSLSDDVLYPLLTRVIDVVIDLTKIF